MGGDIDRDLVVKQQEANKEMQADDHYVISTVYSGGTVYLIGDNPCKAYAYASDFAQLPKQKSLLKF